MTRTALPSLRVTAPGVHLGRVIELARPPDEELVSLERRPQRAAARHRICDGTGAGRRGGERERDQRGSEDHRRLDTRSLSIHQRRRASHRGADAVLGLSARIQRFGGYATDDVALAPEPFDARHH
jgi:hypothetical protein